MIGPQIFWATVIGFLAGVFIRSFLPLGYVAASFTLVLVAALFLLAAITRTRHGLVIGALFLTCGFGMVRMQESVLVLDPRLVAEIDKKVIIEGYVFDEPDGRESGTRLSLRADSLVLKGATSTIAAGVLVIAPLHSGAEYGDRVRAEGTLRLPASFDAAKTAKGGSPLNVPSGEPKALADSSRGDEFRGVGREFNYPAYLAKDGIGFELSFAQVECLSCQGDTLTLRKRNLIKTGAIWVKQTYLEGIALALPEPHAGLAGGITAGDKRALGGALTDVFRTVGLIHIIVLSGYNIMVVIGFIDRVFSPKSWILKLFGRAHRSVRFTLSILVAIFFALITGLAAASVRAAAMAVIATIGKASGRNYAAMRALALVAVLMVLWNPWILAFDPGFQLSVIATWGIITISPLIAARLSFVTERLHLREIVATTIGTQIAVLPLLLYHSGTFSLVSLPANLLALIAVPWAMLASFIAGVFGIVAGPLAPIIGFPAYLLLSYILLIAEWAARIPYTSVTIGTFGLGMLVWLYTVLIVLVLLWKKRTAAVESSRRACKKMTSGR